MAFEYKAVQEAGAAGEIVLKVFYVKYFPAASSKKIVYTENITTPVLSVIACITQSKAQQRLFGQGNRGDRGTG